MGPLDCTFEVGQTLYADGASFEVLSIGSAGIIVREIGSAGRWPFSWEAVARMSLEAPRR